MSPQKAHVLKACSPTGGAVERWLDPQGVNFTINLLMIILNGLLGSEAQLEEVGHWEHTLEGISCP
jgi:hypothetical protein